MKNQLEEGQVVLCEVTKIVGTIVFVRIEEYGMEGTITFPEIAPGRIRNIRDYAFPGKKIVCKVLKVRPDHAELSLRRVKVNERNDFNEKGKKERSYNALIKTLTGEKSKDIINKIKEEKSNIVELFEAAKEDSSILENYFNKEQAQKIFSILNERKEKEILLTRRFTLSSKASDGIKVVKGIIENAMKDIKAEVSYVSAGKYLVKLKTKDPKSGEHQINNMIEEIESSAKKKDCLFNDDGE